MATKHAALSTTQIVATLSTILILLNMYFNHTGQPIIEISLEEMGAIAIVVGNIWIQYRRLQPQTDLHIKKPAVETL